MSKPIQGSKAVDSVQQRFADYTKNLSYSDLSPEAIHSAKLRTIDSLGVLIAGFFGVPARTARNVAAAMPSSRGATIIGTRMKTTPDMAAFVNATTARAVEFNDLYHWPGSRTGHPSDVITPVLAVAEHAQLGGRDYLLGVVLAYEIYCRMCDAVQYNMSIDNTNFSTLGVSLAAGKLLGLTPEQLAHSVSMAAVPNVILNQVRGDHKTHYKVAAAGHAGRAGVFAALLAQAGMEGPHLPFEGKAGYRAHAMQGKLDRAEMGGKAVRFKIMDARTRHRPAMGETHAAILAAEKLCGKFGAVKDVQSIRVETHKRAHELVGNRELSWCWAPQTVESANQSIPYLVAAALLEGTITTRSVDAAHLANQDIRTLMTKIDVVENAEFTKLFNKKVLDDHPLLNSHDRLPSEHWARIIVTTGDGRQHSAETGGDIDDLSVQKKDDQIDAKFRMLTEDVLGSKRVNSILDRLWHMEDMKQVACIPRAFVIA